MKAPFSFLSTLFCLMLLWVVFCKKQDPTPTPGGVMPSAVKQDQEFITDS